jgi:hypothetical protein
MSRPYDSLEERLHALRPARLPGAARQGIVRQLEMPVHRHTVWPVALAGALSLTMVIGCLVLAHRHPGPALGASGGTSSFLAVVSPINANTVLVLRSPLLVTNTQFRR